MYIEHIAMTQCRYFYTTNIWNRNKHSIDSRPEWIILFI